MKQLLFLIYFFVMSLFHAQTQNNLTVRVTNLNNNKGVVQFGLYNVASKFPKVGKTYKMVRLKTKGSQGVYTFKDLPQGRYALAIYHDENANKNCDTNFFGIPTEAYAFSNNVRPRFSAPSFQSCSFWLSQDKEVNIRMVY